MDGSFRDCVGDGAADTSNTCDAADVDDFAVAGLFYPRTGSTAALENGFDVSGEEIFPVIRFYLFQVIVGNEHGGSGIVDEDVEPPEFLEGGFHEFPAKTIVADIALYREGFNPARFDILGGLLGVFFGGAVIDDDMASSLG